MKLTLPILLLLSVSAFGQQSPVSQKNPPLPITYPEGYVKDLERTEREAKKREALNNYDPAKETREAFLKEREAFRLAAVAQSERDRWEWYKQQPQEKGGYFGETYSYYGRLYRLPHFGYHSRSYLHCCVRYRWY